MRELTWTTIAAALALASAGCTHAATIRTRDGRVVEGHILGRVDDDLVVKPRWKPVETVPAGEVADIDHPGDTAAVIGTSLASLGLTAMVVTEIDRRRTDCDPEDPDACEFGRDFGAAVVSSFFLLTFVVPGGSVAAWGLNAHAKSVSRAEGRAEDASLSIKDASGVSVTWQW